MKNIIVCDVQPDFQPHVPDGYFQQVIQHIQSFEHILFVYDTTNGTTQDILQKWLNWFCVDSIVLQHRIEYAAKEYGFFREAMLYANDDDVLQFLKIMQWLKAESSREVDWDAYGPDLLLNEGLAAEQIEIRIPKFLSTERLFRYNQAELIGGHEDLCLRELEIWFKLVGLSYTKNQQYIYGD